MESRFAGLKRQRLFRVIAGYGVIAFGILQGIEPVMHGLHWPDAVLTWVVLGLGAGFPLALLVAWASDRGPGNRSRGLRAAALLLGLGALAAAPGVAWYLWLRPETRQQKAAAASEPPSVAVLPFVDMSAGHDQEYLSDGVAEEILNALAQVHGLRVAGRTSSFAFKGKADDLTSIAQRLHVGKVLEGSVRKEGTRVRVTVQLINASDGFQVWSRTFDRELAGIFALQDEIAREVAGTLSSSLLPSQPGVQTTDPEVYRLYLLGRQLVWQGTPEDIQRSVDLLGQAVRRDPAYAPAQAWLGLATFTRAAIASDASAAILANQRALAFAERAIALAPSGAEGYSVRGFLRSAIGWDWSGAQSDYQRALALAPGDANTLVHYGQFLLKLGRYEESGRLLQEAAAADPLAPNAIRWLGVFQAATGNLVQAERTLQRGLESSPRNAYLLRELGIAYVIAGKGEEALAVFEQHPVEWMRLFGVSLAQHARGDEAASTRALEELINSAGAGVAYQIGQAYAFRGQKSEALDWLEKGLALDDAGMRFAVFDPLLRGLRREPRYLALLAKMNLPAP